MEGLAIVTGGAGFIGSHLVSRLVEGGQPVRVVERSKRRSLICRPGWMWSSPTFAIKAQWRRHSKAVDGSTI